MGPGWARNAMFHFISFQNGIFDAGLPQVGGSDANPSDLNEDPDHESRCSSREGRGYVANICSGQPTYDTGKCINHCGKCPQFGNCIGDYRLTCSSCT